MKDRPKIKLVSTATDKTIEAAGVIALIVLWGYTISNYSSLPDSIPTHYNAKGVIDAYGSKDSIFGLPVIVTLLFIGLTWMTKFPHKLNYLAEINEQNAHDQYSIATRMLRILKLNVVIVFGVIDYQTVQSSFGNPNVLGKWFFPLTIALIVIPIMYFMIKASSDRK